jgi:hypothetical protein
MFSPKSKSKISHATHKVNLGNSKDSMQIQIQISDKKRFLGFPADQPSGASPMIPSSFFH